MSTGSGGLSSYPAPAFPNGLVLGGMPLVQTNPGRVIWVYNGTVIPPGQIAGADSGAGPNYGTFQKPYKTLVYALGQAVASRGDIIILKQGHAETYSSATAITMATAGVAVIGLGYGSLRPTFTLDTGTTSTINVTAANIAIQNCIFIANFAAIASTFTLTNAPGFTVERCEFRDTSSALNFVSIVTGDGTANHMDGLNFNFNRIKSLGTTAGTTAIVTTVAQDRWSIRDNFGCWAAVNSTPAMVQAGANNLTNFDFGRNILERPNTASVGGSFIGTSGTAWTGHAYDNYMYQLTAAAGLWIATGTGGAFGFSNNFSPITGAVDKSGLINPAAV